MTCCGKYSRCLKIVVTLKADSAGELEVVVVGWRLLKSLSDWRFWVDFGGLGCMLGHRL